MKKVFSKFISRLQKQGINIVRWGLQKRNAWKESLAEGFLKSMWTRLHDAIRGRKALGLWGVGT